MANEGGNSQIIRRLFEQSFLVICLALASYFLVVEYKELFERLQKKNDRDEELLRERVNSLKQENRELYERLIKCEK